MDLYENTVKNEAILQTFSTSATLAIDDGRPGQSSPARAWLDCTNFVSQCLFAGSGGDSAKLLSAHTVDRYMTKYTNGTYKNWSLQSLYNDNLTLYGYEIDSIF